jgi:hypothetical protein
LSAQGEKVIVFAIVAGLLSVLSVGFATLRAPVSALALPVVLILVSIVAVRRDLRHVHRHGWSDSRGPDGSDGQSPQDSGPPDPPSPSGDGVEFDWDAFVTQFWEHLDREPVA